MTARAGAVRVVFLGAQGGTLGDSDSRRGAFQDGGGDTRCRRISCGRWLAEEEEALDESAHDAGTDHLLQHLHHCACLLDGIDVVQLGKVRVTGPVERPRVAAIAHTAFGSLTRRRGRSNDGSPFRTASAALELLESERLS